ncbi:hypothetical protein HDU93_003516, partial [Gonapodya sp. JEL0774]
MAALRPPALEEVARPKSRNFIRSGTAPTVGGRSSVAETLLPPPSEILPEYSTTSRPGSSGPNVGSLESQSPQSQFSELSSQLRRNSRSSGERPKSTPWHWKQGPMGEEIMVFDIPPGFGGGSGYDENSHSHYVPDAANLKRHASVTAEMFQMLTAETPGIGSSTASGFENAGYQSERDSGVDRETRRVASWERES